MILKQGRINDIIALDWWEQRYEVKRKQGVSLNKQVLLVGW